MQNYLRDFQAVGRGDNRRSMTLTGQRLLSLLPIILIYRKLYLDA